MTDRYPIGPLLDVLAQQGATTAKAIASSLRTSWSRTALIIERGYIRWDIADRYACRLGLHPLEVWPEWDDPTPQCQQCTDTHDCPAHTLDEGVMASKAS